MSKIHYLAILCLAVTACSRCPTECTASAIAECENQDAIFRSKLSEIIVKRSDLQHLLVTKEDGSGMKFATEHEPAVLEVITRKQKEWNEAQIRINAMLDQNDLDKICKFLKNDSASLAELQELAEVANRKQSRAGTTETGILESAVFEIAQSTKS